MLFCLIGWLFFGMMRTGRKDVGGSLAVVYWYESVLSRWCVVVVNLFGMGEFSNFCLDRGIFL